MQRSKNLSNAAARGEPFARFDFGRAATHRRVFMSISNRMHQPIAMNEDVATKVRNVIAEYLGLDAKRVSDEAHFLKDLGADWLDRLELMIVMEDQFGVEIGDEAVDRIQAVGDLIRFIESRRLH
jgi:acyl carrier protein